MLAIVGSAVFLVVAPGFVAGLVPRWISRWRFEPAFFAMPAFRFAGGLLMMLGGIGLLDSFVRFAVQGVGTPAPVFPTRHLVVTGLYRHVRNPMYVAVVSAISRSRLVLRKRRAGGIRRACLAAVSLVRADLRRADPQGEFCP